VLLVPKAHKVYKASLVILAQQAALARKACKALRVLLAQQVLLAALAQQELPEQLDCKVRKVFKV
jgi:hypothetical protein